MDKEYTKNYVTIQNVTISTNEIRAVKLVETQFHDDNDYSLEIAYPLGHIISIDLPDHETATSSFQKLNDYLNITTL